MSKLLLCCVFLLACVSLASADNIRQILTVNLNEGQCANDNFCASDPGGGGSPATASADFQPSMEPWIFNGTTRNALSWYGEGGDYHAIFGYGGTFDISGPEGLIFTGVVTSGVAAMDGPGVWVVDVNYFGQWSNGLYGYGTADGQIMEPRTHRSRLPAGRGAVPSL
jgi:hypothetical protein